MKSLFATLILLIVLLGSITVNFFFINRVADRMEEMIDALPSIDSDTCKAKTQEIRNYWEDRTDLIGLSVGYNIIDRVCEQAALLVACAEVQDLYGYHSAQALLRDAVGDVRRAEQFSVGNLL
ncbi:MAG: DUF4363 family protein [Clostridia bacterium]|nr:DUF4363 family protein [Clostridia bacterium]